LPSPLPLYVAIQKCRISHRNEYIRSCKKSWCSALFTFSSIQIAKSAKISGPRPLPSTFFSLLHSTTRRFIVWTNEEVEADYSGGQSSPWAVVPRGRNLHTNPCIVYCSEGINWRWERLYYMYIYDDVCNCRLQLINNACRWYTSTYTSCQAHVLNWNHVLNTTCAVKKLMIMWIYPRSRFCMLPALCVDLVWLVVLCFPADMNLKAPVAFLPTSAFMSVLCSVWFYWNCSHLDYSLIGRYRCFGGKYCLNLYCLNIEGSKTCV
jgi:hypothetical protein